MTFSINEFLATMLGITLSMSAAIAALLLLRRFMKKRFTAGCRFMIWTLVMLRLCLPIGGVFMPAIISVSYPEEITAPKQEENTIIENSGLISDGTLEEEPQFFIPSDTVPSVVIPQNEFICAPDFAPVPPAKAPAAQASTFKISAEMISRAVFCAWAIGTVTFVFVCLANYNISAHNIRRTSTLADAETTELYHQLCREMNIKRIPTLQVSSAVTSPMLYGYFSQRIVLPDIELSAGALKSVLSHELTHYKRCDIYLKLISMLGNAIHWFNPLSYAAAKTFAAEMELSCDESVLRGCDDIVRVSYGKVMLDIIKSSRGTANMLTTSFNPSANAVKERFAGILDTNKKGRGRAIISFIMVLCLVSGSLLGYEVSAIENILPPIEDEEPEITEPKETEADTTAPSDVVITPESEAIPNETEAVTEEATAPETQTEKPEDTTSEAKKPEDTTAKEAEKKEPTEAGTLTSKPETSEKEKEPETSRTEDQTAQTEPPKKSETTVVTPAETDSSQSTVSSSANIGTFTEKNEGLPDFSITPSGSSAHTHTYASMRVPASCCAAGYTDYSCVRCEHSYRVVEYKTDKHVTRLEERSAVVNGENTVYNAEICKFCGIEISFKKSVWDGTNLSFYISGPLFYDGEYNANGELVVYGTGAMPSYASLDELKKGNTSSKLPAWWQHNSDYASIRIGDNITSVSANAFAYACDHVNTIKIGKSVTAIGKNAFKGATNIETLYIPRSLKRIEIDAFNLYSVENIKYEGSPEEFFKLDLGNLRVTTVEFNVKY